MAAAFRSLLAPGDGVVVMQPYQELVPVAGGDFRARAPLRDPPRGSPHRNLAAGPRRAAGRPGRSGGQGGGREHPQNPTGKVPDEEDLGFIAELCRTHAVQILACIALIRSSDPSVRAKLTLDDGAAEFIDGEA